MNVMQLISSRLGYYGAERVVVTLSSALEEMGVKSFVGAFQNGPKHGCLEVLDQARMRGVETASILCKGRLDRKAIDTIRDIVARHNIDVVHCHGIKADLYALLAASQDVALVSTCHLWVFDSAKSWTISALERCMLHGIDRVVAVSDHIIPQLRRFGLKAEVVNNGIDLEPYANSSSRFRKSMHWCERPVVGAIGRLADQKGLQYLLRAAAELLKDIPNAVFVFAGDGPEQTHLEAEAKSLGIKEAVHFIGVRDDIPDILASIDVLAMPSLSEGLPMALLEAMASAKAVVTTPVGAIPRVIENESNGMLVTPGDVKSLTDALRVLLNSSELRLTLGRNARETVTSRFSAASMANQYLKIYREAAFSKGRLVQQASL